MNPSNLPPFYVGQKVVALKSSKGETKGMVKKGNIYTVAACIWYVCNCGKNWDVALLEIKGCFDNSRCLKCNEVLQHHGIFHFIGNAKFFAPITENFQSISYDKIMEKESPLISVN